MPRFAVQHTTPRPGFTLIELLVVVAIIAALLAILLPAMGRARAIAQIAVCASNQDQQHTASLTYASEHFGLLPHNQQNYFHSVANGWNWYSNTAPGFRDNFWWQTKPYLQSPAAWDCPTVTPIQSSEYSATYPMPPLAVMGNAFVIGVTGASWPFGNEPIRPRTVSMIRNTSLASMFNDFGWKYHSVWTSFSVNGVWSGGHHPQPAHLKGAANEGANVVYVDGHVEYRGGEDFKVGPGDYFDPNKVWWRKGTHGWP